MALVLYAGTNPSLAETRRMLLEVAGHTVVTALDDSEIAAACRRQKFDVVVIGHTGEPELKQGRLTIIRKTCPSVKIVELFRQNSSPVLDHVDASIEIGDPSAFLAIIAGLVIDR